MKQLHVHPFFIALAIRLGLCFQAEKNVCELCHKNLYDTPYYCAIKPDLPQCIVPVCPKICEVVGMDSDPASKIKKKLVIPYSIGDMGKQFPHPPYLPKAAPEYFLPLSTLQAREETGGIAGNLTNGTAEPPPPPKKKPPVKTEDTFGHYDENTCDLKSSQLIPVTTGSKFIEYKPSDPKKSVAEIKQAAEAFGLVLAEFRRPEEELWFCSSLLDVVSTFNKDQPRVYYAYGLKDIENIPSSISGDSKKKDGPASVEDHGNFTYYDGTKITHAMLDPRQFGRTDEHCSVLTYVMSEAQRYLITRMRNCHTQVEDNEALYGLLMYPPGSFCYRRSNEECNVRKQHDAGGETIFHNIIEIGQTLKRFIYFYSDQRTWADAKLFCENKGLLLLDLDPRWDDANRVREVIEHYLRNTIFNPLTMFWTSGKFENKFSDGKFRWETTGSTLQTHYRGKAPPYQFSWWDDQKEILELFKDTPNIPRRKNIQRPCVALAINPEDGAERPKINFKAWYCDFPSFFLCYKEINQTDNIFDGPTQSMSDRSRPEPAKDACSARNDSDSTSGKSPGENATESEQIDPYDENCESSSTTAKKIFPNSKFIAFEPKWKKFTVQQIKEKCYEFNLVPAEITTIEDWLSISRSGIGSVLSGDSERVDYFYAIGTEDIEELGKLQYNASGTPITFAMFYPEGKTGNVRRCVMLDTVPTSGSDLTPPSMELMMQHVPCSVGDTDEKVAYGICMFKSDSDCFKNSQEEIAFRNDTKKSSTIIPIGTTGNRSIFLNPKQRTWDEAKKFCEKANLSLLDFDFGKWPDDVTQIITLFKEKISHETGLNKLTPFWTSGKIQGTYSPEGASGTWDSTKGKIDFGPTGNRKWLKYRWQNLTDLREGTVKDGCVEASFDDINKVVMLKPGFCNVPKFFLCYRKSRKRWNDPLPQNSLGIYIVDTDDAADDESNGEYPGQMKPKSSNLVGKFPPIEARMQNDFHPPDGQVESDEEDDGAEGFAEYVGEEEKSEGKSEKEEDDATKQQLVDPNPNKPGTDRGKGQGQGAKDDKKEKGNVYLDMPRPKRKIG